MPSGSQGSWPAAAARLDRFLAEQTEDLSRSAAARLIKSHLVRINGHTADPADRVAAGDLVEFEIPEAYVSDVVPEAIPLEIVYGGIRHLQGMEDRRKLR